MTDIHAGRVASHPEWLWSISHPSFYFWNRMISVACPFLTIFIAMGVRAIYKTVERHGSRVAMRSALIALLALFASIQVVSSWVAAAHALGDRDSRSKLVDAMNRLPAILTLVVPNDLHIHQQDLSRLKVAYRVVPAREIASFCSKPADGTALVLPLLLAEDGNTAQMLADQTLYASLIDGAARGPATFYRVVGSPLSMNSPIRSPGLMVVPLSVELCASIGRG